MALGWRGPYARYKEFFLNILILYKKKADLRMFLEVILSLVTIIIFSLFALKPTVLTIISLTKEIKQKEETVGKLDQKITNLEKAQINYSQEPGIADIEAAIPNFPSPNILVRQIEGVAARNSVSILGVSIGEVVFVGEQKTKKRSGEVKDLPLEAKEMAISVSSTAPYSALYAMVRDLENLRLPIKIDVLGVNSSSSEEGLTIVAIVSGRTPFLGR